MFSILHQPLPLGLDISDYKLRLVQLQKISRKKIKLSSYSEIDVPQGVIIDGQITDDNKMIVLINTLKKNIKGAVLRQNKVIVGLPEKQSFIKLINFSSALKTDDNIQKEIIKHLPYNLEDIYFDYKLINNFGSYSTALHFAACKKTLIKNYTSVLSETGFQPIVFELENEATTRCLIPSKDKAPYLIIDIGRARTTLSLVTENIVTFAISFKSIMTNQEAYISELAAQILKIIKFQNQYHINEKNISAMLICGTGAYIKNLEEEMLRNFNIKLLLGNPWQNIYNYNSNLVKKINYPLGYTTAIGLALRPALNNNFI